MGEAAVTTGSHTAGTRPPAAKGAERLTSAERLVFFSDAVFAIAMTLLVLDLKLPEMGEQVSRHEYEAALVSRIPNLIAFVLSFTIIAGLWVTHHNRFETVEKVDRRSLELSLVLLFFVAIMPMPTALVMQPWAGSPWAVILYAITVGGAYFMLNVLWWHLHRQGLSGMPDNEYKARQIATSSVSLVFLVSIPAALLNPRYAYLVWMLIAPVTVIVGRYVRRRYGIDNL